MTVTFNRKQTPIKILDDGKHVGNIRKADYGFYVEINGVYYAPNRRIRINSGGAVCIGFKKLYDARLHARAVLNIITVTPYSKRR